MQLFMGLKNILYATGIAGAMLFAGNSYSQNASEEYIKIENIEKKSRKLEEQAKNLSSTLIYTNPTAISFDSLDQKTKNRLWSILSNHYELETEQYENKLKELEATKEKNVEFQKTIEALILEKKAKTEEIKELKKKYEPADNIKR